ncbi:hypothetical protein, partial [Bacillus thuringiensis]|uniref:hypothetical protein n=2 Tax=Bacillaceae TaxID=186817 RepID=UPI0030FF11AE
SEMGIHTKKMIKSLEQKMAFCVKVVFKSIRNDEEKKINEVIHNSISDINMMLSLIETYMKVEKESTKELKQLQKKLIQTRSYIEFECNKLKISI